MRKLGLVNVHLCLFPLVFPSERAELLGSAFHTARLSWTRRNFPRLCIYVILPYQMQLFPLLTSTLPWRTHGSSQNAVDNRILYSGLIAKVQMQHICALLLFALICYNSSCHKFQQITKEKVKRVDKPLEMFIWRMKEGKKPPKAGEDVYQTNWDQWSKRHREVNQNVSPSEIREPPGKEWLHFQVRNETTSHFAEKHQ